LIYFYDIGEINFTLLLALFIVFVVLIYILRPSWKILLTSFLLLVLLTIGTTVVWNRILTDYQKKRIETFSQGPESDPSGTGFQVIQSEVSIGSGMLVGKGYLAGSQSSLNVLTQGNNDFVFASFAEQFGFIGSTLLLGLYLTLILRVLASSSDSKDLFGKNISMSVALLLLLHIFINIGMNVGLLPVTGIPLPLMSSGGSSIIVIMIALGFVQSINSSKRPIDFAESLMLRSASQIS